MKQGSAPASEPILGWRRHAAPPAGIDACHCDLFCARPNDTSEVAGKRAVFSYRLIGGWIGRNVRIHHIPILTFCVVWRVGQRLSAFLGLFLWVVHWAESILPHVEKKPCSGVLQSQAAVRPEGGLRNLVYDVLRSSCADEKHRIALVTTSRIRRRGKSFCNRTFQGE